MKNNINNKDLIKNNSTSKESKNKFPKKCSCKFNYGVNCFTGSCRSCGLPK